MSQKLLTNIHAVIFDVGNTLTAPDWERIHLAGRRFRDFGLDETELQKRLAKILIAADDDRDFLRQLAGKSIRTSWHFHKLYKDIGLDDWQLEEFMTVLDKLHFEKHLWTKLNADVFPVLNELKSRNLRLGTISNSEDGRVEDVLKAVGIVNFLDVRLDSHVVGFTKPDAKIFLKAVNELGVEPEKTLFVGDSYTQDIIGANRAGLKGILFDPLNLHPQRDVIKIKSLREILN